MGRLNFTPLQKSIFDGFSAKNLARNFYFTGGTALSVFYLHHRISEDMDFFSEVDFENQLVIDFVTEISKSLNLTYDFTQRYKARVFELQKKGKTKIKIDFVHYPYKRVEEGIKVDNIFVDSLRDIGGNKLLCINQRTDIKDFVDLYFLLKKFSIWDLLYVVEAKFRMEMDMVLIASDFAKVEDFKFLPKMLVPLELSTLQKFFRDQAKEIGKRITK